MVRIAEILEEMRITLRDPRQGAARALTWPIPVEAIFPFFALSVVLSTLAAELNSLLNPPEPGQPAVFIAPLLLAVMFGAVNAAMALALTLLGRIFGGKGELPQALILMAWQQYIAFVALLALTAISLISPGLAGILTLAFAVYLIWLLVCFTSVLHDFNELGIAAVVAILASIISALAFFILVGAFAVTQGGGLTQ